MKLNKIFLTLSVATVTFISCNLAEDMNTSPNKFIDAPSHLILRRGQMSVAKIFTGNSSRIASIFSDQMTGIENQYGSVNKFDVQSGSFDEGWAEVYRGVAHCRIAREKAIKSGNAKLEGVSYIMEAYLFGNATSLWGDMPYSEACNRTKFPKPKYDTQLDIFKEVQNTLDLGISKVGDLTVNADFGAPLLASSSSWAQVAHSLKARYYLLTKNYAQALLESKKGISSVAGNFVVLHDDTDKKRNLMYQFCNLQRPNYVMPKSSHLFKLVTGATPRLLGTPGDLERSDFYFASKFKKDISGKDSLDIAGKKIREFSGDFNFGSGYYAESASNNLVSYYEVKLIEAESAQRTGDEAGALIAFNKVRTDLGVQYKSSFPPSTANGDVLLKQILEEKYITLLGSIQVFLDINRTNNVLGVPVKDTSKNTTIPQRFLYPQSEFNSNKANVPANKGLFVKTRVNK